MSAAMAAATAAGDPGYVADLGWMADHATSGGLPGLADRFERPFRTLGELRLSAIEAGCPYAAFYVEAARTSLRHALAAIVERSGEGGRASEAGPTPLALGIGDIAVLRSDGPLIRRGRLRDATPGMAFEVDEDADVPPRPAEPTLPEDLLADARVRDLCAGPAFSALLAAALGHHRWIHLASGRTVSLDVPSATVVVSMISGGRPVTGWPYGTASTLIDAGVTRELLRLGWRRLSPPGLQPEAVRRGCREIGIDIGS